MIDLLIVDDEALIREALISRVKKGNYEFKHIYEAGSGEEAIEIINLHHPKLVITDVKMYDISGLDLIRMCESKTQKPKFIVISGYAEFKYVQESINQGAYGYLLKPITNEKLFETIDKVLETIKEANVFNEVKRENSSLILSQLLLKCISNNMENEDYEQFMELLEAKDSNQLVVGMSHLSKYCLDRFNTINDAYDYFFECLQDLADIQVSILMGRTKYDRYLIFHSKSMDPINTSVYDYLLTCLHRLQICGTTITVGISSSSPLLSETLFQEAKSSLNERFSQGNGSAFQKETLIPSQLPEILGLDIKALENDLKFKNSKDIKEKLVSIISSCSPLIHNMDFLVYNIYIILIRLDFVIDETRWGYFLEQKLWNNCENKEEVVNLLIEEINNAFSHDTSDKFKKSYVELAKNYIQNNFESELTLNSIAEQFNLNPRYFSTLFKKKESLSLMEYLTKVRMEEAKRLLLNTDIPASEIAISVGYEDARYFYKVFKKYTGVTPSIYREK